LGISFASEEKDRGCSTLKFSTDPVDECQCILGKVGKTSPTNIEGDACVVAHEKGRPIVFSIFHEFCHWFHYLRHPQRHDKDRVVLFKYAYHDLFLPKFVFERLINAESTEEEKKESLSPFLSKKDGDVYYNQEEHRTVCGFPRDYENFLFGDEHSENSFICSYNLVKKKSFSIRGGHKDFPFIEDGRVEESIRCLCGCGKASEQSKLLSVKLVDLSVKGLGLHYNIHEETHLVFRSASEAPITRKPVFQVEQGKDRRSSVS
jgi:hypothetical protein